MNKRDSGVILIFTIIVTQILLLLYLVSIIDIPTPDSFNNQTNVPAYTSFQSLSNMIHDFSKSHKYINSSKAELLNESPYMCMNYSRDLVKELRAHGYDSYVRHGCRKRDSLCHAWVEIHLQVEPILGYIAHNYSEEYPIGNSLFK